MPKRIFIIHGWEGYPKEGWFPWVKKELEKQGYKVQVPAMPDTEEPKIEVWVSFLNKIVGEIDENTYFIGHSIGCQAILRYFESFKKGERAGGAVLVAPWLTLTDQAIPGPEEKAIARPWLEIALNFEKIRQISDNFIAIFSDNDEYVPKENQAIFKEKLGAKTILERNKGHFSGEDGIKELPIILEVIKEF